jgi:hypothetical protein
LSIAVQTAPRAAIIAAPHRMAVAVLGAYVALTVVLFWPWFAHLGSALIGPPEDNMQDLWNTWYAAAGHGRDFFHTRLLHYPGGTSLRYQSFAYPQVFAVAALSKLFGTSLATLVTLQNVTILASFPIAAAGAFYLVRYVTASDAAGAVGGFFFAFNPWHVAMAMHHAHVAGIEFIPFFVLAYLVAIERRSIAWLVGATVFYALSALMCWYYLFYIAYFIAFHFVWKVFRYHRIPEGWDLIAPVAAMAGCAVLLSPLLVPMVAESFGKTVYADGTNRFVADLLAYVTPPPTHLIGGWTKEFYARLTGNPWDSTVYIGAASLAVLAVWYVKRRKAEALPGYVAAGIVTFCVIASGDCVHIGGQPTILHLPTVVLSKLPFFANVRTPSRAIVFVYLFAAMGIGSAFALLLRDASRLRQFAAAAIAALIFADFTPAHLASTPVGCDPGFAVLRDDPAADFGVVSLPAGYAESNAAMLDQVCHGRPLAGGNTTRNTVDSLTYRLNTTDMRAQRDQLRRAHVKYIVVHAPQGTLFAWTEMSGSQSRLLAAYPQVYRDATLTILRVY